MEELTKYKILAMDIYQDFFNIGRFHKENLNIEGAIKAGMIPKSKLKDGQEYIGRCRNTTIAKWSMKHNAFIYMRQKFNSSYEDTCNHPEDDEGYDVFIPVKEYESID